MSIQKRIEKIEKDTGASKQERPWLIAVLDDTRRPSKEELEKVKAEYKKEHPDWQGRDFNIIWVIDEETKDLIGQIKDRTGKTIYLTQEAIWFSGEYHGSNLGNLTSR